MLNNSRILYNNCVGRLRTFMPIYDSSQKIEKYLEIITLATKNVLALAPPSNIVIFRRLLCHHL